MNRGMRRIFKSKKNGVTVECRKVHSEQLNYICGTDDLTVDEVTGSECSDSESEDAQCATASSAPTATNATFK